MQLFWSSLSIPKEIIPTVYLYFPQYVDASPYQVTVNTGPTIPEKSTATGLGLYEATVGKISYIDLVSRDNARQPLDNVNDVYSLYLQGPGSSNTGDIHFYSVYQGPVG